MEFNASWWEEPIIPANYQLQQILLEITPLLPGTSSSLQEKVTTYLESNAYLGTATLEEIASNLNYSARTLQRRFQKEVSHFRSFQMKYANRWLFVICDQMPNL